MAGDQRKTSRRKGVHTPHAPIGDVRDPESLYHYLQRFLAWLAERNYSPKTIVNREELLRVFIAWLDERGIRRPHEVTKPIIERYQSHLFVYRKKDGQPLSARTQHGHITPIRAWSKWLAKQNFILYNPASDLDLPRLDRRLPRNVLTIKEAEAVLAMPDLETPGGIRDRAMLEVLYSTGMRRMELMQLQVFDVDAERGTVLIRQGKGRKDRMVPIGERAIAWVEKYRDDVRPELATGADDGTLFLTHLGEGFSPNRLTQLVREYVQGAQIGKSGSCHRFRHTMATLMLENGADIRYIQAILGHAELSTTQIYTQVSIRQLKAIHSATHPARMPGAGARKKRRGRADPSTDAADASLPCPPRLPGLPSAPARRGLPEQPKTNSQTRLPMRCKPPKSPCTARGSVLKAQRVKAKPFGRAARGLDASTAVSAREAKGS